jgi:hypothetical protein
MFVGEYGLKEAIICSEFFLLHHSEDDAWLETQGITCDVQ